MQGTVLCEDILQPIPIGKWPILQNKLKKDWPAFAYYYYWIENAIRWKRKNPNFLIQVYCPNGDYEEGTFVGISCFAIYIVVAFTLEPDVTNLKNLLIETKQIDWSQGVYIAAVHESMLPTILSFAEHLRNTKGIEQYPLTPGNYYFKPAEECINVEITVPDECYMKPLEQSNVTIIHSVWPHRDENRPDLSTKFLRTLIEMNGGIGLFLKKDDSLVSWALHSDWCGMGMLQTLDEHKGKGFAKIVINALAKKLAEEDISTTLFIVNNNKPSEKLFHNLNFKKISPIAWVVLKKKQESNISG